MIEWRADELNETLRPIADHIGVPVAEAMVRAFGGMRIHIPKLWREGHMLGALGEDIARQLIAEFAGEVITVPRSLVSATARIARAEAMRRDGATVNEIARALGLSFRSTQEHLAGRAISAQPRKRLAHDPRQIDIDDLIIDKKTA